MAKLTAHDVRQIRLLLQQGESQRTIAARYHVTHTNIGYIARGEHWRHILDTPEVSRG